MKRLVLAGGGHAHVEVLRRLALAPEPGVETVLVSPVEHAGCSGMLPGYIAGRYSYDECHIDLRRLAAWAGCRFEPRAAAAFECAHRQIRFADGTALPYDVLSIDIGSQPPSVPGVAEHALPVKPLPRFLAGIENIVAMRDSPRIAIVGGGAAGVEVCLALRARLSAASPRLLLLTSDQVILPGHSRSTRGLVHRCLQQYGVGIRTGARVCAAGAQGLTLEQGESVGADAVIWATGAAPPPSLRSAGLATDAAGFVTVNHFLQSVSHAEVFVAGDAASMSGQARPKSGVYAVRQGPPLAANLVSALRGAALVAYRPQERTLALIATGDGRAVLSWGGFALLGAWLWRWILRIDVRFMARFRAPDAVPVT